MSNGSAPQFPEIGSRRIGTAGRLRAANRVETAGSLGQSGRLRAARTAARAALTLLAAVALAFGGLTTAAQPADAAPRVSVTVVDRPNLSNTADSKYLTEVRVSGSGFQSVKNGFGGIYVLFGWAGSGWRPSQGGKTGSDYRYVCDDETNPIGYQLFVAFPGSSTEYAANGGHIAANGTWSATMRIPGPKFQAYDRAGKISTVDCLKSQCGIMTIGAHGVVNANNESFTPLSFQSIYGAGDGKEVVSSTGKPTVAAPTSVGGRPATVPADVDAASLSEKKSGDVTVVSGETRLKVTVPGAKPKSWVGVTFYSDPLFAGWFQPNSAGVIDVNLPENLPEGQHRLVVQSEGDAVIGWAEFERASVTAAESSEAGTAPAAAAEAAPGEENLTPLIAAVIGVGVLAIAAIIFLVIVLVRTRRPRAAAVTGAAAVAETASAEPASAADYTADSTAERALASASADTAANGDPS